MSLRTINAGTKMFFGAPAKPMPHERKESITQAVTGVAGVSEAYLPQCFIEGDSEARQILAVAVEKKEDVPRVADEIMSKLKSVLPDGDFIDILPYPSTSFPAEARVAKCQIIGSTAKPWWKLW